MSTANAEPAYTPSQKAVALAYGAACHGLFVLGVGAMVYGLYNGMTGSWGRLQGAAAFAANAALVLQFPILHSLVLGRHGRRWLAHMAPLGLGRDLATTSFVIFASLQLAVTFLLWSPTSTVWFEPHGTLKIAWSFVYAATWFLLVKTMNDAGMETQTGSLGWLSIVRGRKPAFHGFEVRGLHHYSRQPVYLAFALTLWTGPVWTPHRLWLALAWTAYCLIGPLFKERRYRAYHGNRYRIYQWMVPYWIPRVPRIGLQGPVLRAARRQPPPAAHPEGRPEIVICGAGPVGLLLANLLGQRGIETLVVERRTAPPEMSMAIGVTPPSLQILKSLGLDQDLVANGVPIEDAFVHGTSSLLGSVSFRRLPGDYRSILSVPQGATMRVLEAGLARFPSVRVRRGVELLGFTQSGDTVTVRIKDASGLEEQVSARFLVACDGSRSLVRSQAGVPRAEKDYGLSFLMGDFEDRTGMGTEAHLFFTPTGSVESFPLPGGRRRWVVLTDGLLENAPHGFLAETVRARCGHDLSGSRQFNQSPFHVRRALCSRYYTGRVVFCGDAAHVISPIGGQGMNTGFADAQLLADTLVRICREGFEAEDLLRHYDYFRRRAFAAASGRAALGMWLGTRTGRTTSRLRDFFLRKLLLRPRFREALPEQFAMLAIPFNTLASVPELADRPPTGH